MDVIATAGHVDHGKSALVRALTGMEPDRWAEERRRGLTIDLGFAWTTLPSGRRLAVVDVPGHERFVGNMLAGVGSVPAALVVVAADDGWSAQTAEHVAVLDALGVRHALLAVTKCRPRRPRARCWPTPRDRLAGTSMGEVPGVAVSALHRRRAARADAPPWSTLLAGLPAPDPAAPVRLWIDRAFTIRGAGTVVTGTLAAGTVAAGDRLHLGGREVTVRGVQSLGEPVERAAATARVALNLRGVAVEDLSRGDALLTPGAFRAHRRRRRRPWPAAPEGRLPAEAVVHIGSATVGARLRPLDGARGAPAARRAPAAAGRRPAAAARPGDPAGAGRRRAGRRPAGAAPAGRGAAARRRARRPAARNRRRVGRPGPPPGRPGRRLRRDGLAGARRTPRRTGPGCSPPGWPTSSPPRVPARGRPLPAAAAAGARPAGGGGAAGARPAGRRPGRRRRPAAARRCATAGWSTAPPSCRRRCSGPSTRSGPGWPTTRSPLRRPGPRRRRARLARAGRGGAQRPARTDRRRRLPRAGRRGRGAGPAGAIPQPFTLSQARQAWGTSRRVAVPLAEWLDAQGITVRLPDNTRRLR